MSWQWDEDRSLVVRARFTPDQGAALIAAIEVPTPSRTPGRRMGFSADDLADLSNRLVDGVTVWGDLDAIVRRIEEYRAAGADQIVVQLGRLSREWWSRLAEAVI